MLLVNDGSTNHSATIGRDIVERHPDCFRYLAHPGEVNRGMSATLNLGIAQGKRGIRGLPRRRRSLAAPKAGIAGRLE